MSKALSEQRRGQRLSGSVRMASWIDSNVEKVAMEFLSHQRKAA